MSENEGNQLTLPRGLTLWVVSPGATLIRLVLSCCSLAAGACATALPETRKKVLSALLLRFPGQTTIYVELNTFYNIKHIMLFSWKRERWMHWQI